MSILSIDLETYSSIDLAKCGVYAYTESFDFKILLFAYAFDDDPVRVIDLDQGEEIPIKVLQALDNPEIIKTAFNANFERTCLAKMFGQTMPAAQWKCSAVHALTLGLPHSLEAVGKALKLQNAKMSEGKALIRYFCVPCKATKANGGRTKNLPKHDPEKWEIFKTYCQRDVEVEREVRKLVSRFEVPEVEQRIWQLDQKINDTGVKVDKVLIENAINIDAAYQHQLEAQAIELTGLENPKSVAQLKKWLKDAEGLEVESLNKAAIPEILEKTESESVKQVLKLRQELSKTSIKKYKAMQRAMCPDQRIRGLMQLYGANRTGRWAGRLVQIHNLPQNKLPDLELARELLSSGEFETIELLFDSVPEVLSQLVRTAFIPEFGCRFIVADLSAIEARVLSWIAGEKWVLDTFRSHGRIYESTASKMFKIPIEKIVKGNPEYALRQKGKVATLSCGYQGSVGALIALGALKMGLSEEELPELVASWRKANPAIVRFWCGVEKAAIQAIQERTTVKMQYGLAFSYKSGILFVRLPSGRRLAYVRPKLEREEQFNKIGITYEGTEQTTKKWGRLRTYGGKLVENLTQAIARDVLADIMLRLDAKNYQIAFHVHDECVIEAPIEFGSLEEVINIMREPISWAPGLPLNADGFETYHYKKD